MWVLQIFLSICVPIGSPIVVPIISNWLSILEDGCWDVSNVFICLNCMKNMSILNSGSFLKFESRYIYMIKTSPDKIILIIIKNKSKVIPKKMTFICGNPVWKKLMV